MEKHFNISFQDSNAFDIEFQDSDSFGTDFGGEVYEIHERNYNNLSNKPSIENVTLVGNKTFEELGLKRMTNWDIERIILLN